MDLFFSLLFRILPLYFIIFLGYIAGRVLKIEKEVLAKLLLYLIIPVVIFNGAYKAPITLGTMALPIMFFLTASTMCLIAYRVYSYMWKGSEKNILAFAAGTGNTGYFGIPVGIALFGEQVVPIITLCILGFILYENTLGFFLTARGSHTLEESIQKLIRLPAIYAFVVGLLFNIMKIPLDGGYTSLVTNFQGALSVLGMMLIGVGMASIGKADFDVKFLSAAFLVRFLAWPLVVVSLIALDSNLFHIFNQQIYNVMILMSVVPLAANTVVFASMLKVHPEKAAMAVVLTTLFALFYIPLIVTLFRIG